MACTILALALGTVLAAVPRPDAETGTGKPASSPGSKTQKHHKRVPAKAPAPAVAAPILPIMPPEAVALIPHWPANDRPTDAVVTWDSHGLRIEAANSSLAQILHDVSTATGTQVDGFATDQRIFGSYGPGQARDVLAQLLQGSGYNLLMVGDQGQGTPRELLLSARNATAGPTPTKPGSTGEDEDADTEEPAPQPVLQPDQPHPNGIPARTPQQMMQEMQLRQQQMERRGVPQNQPILTAPPQ